MAELTVYEKRTCSTCRSLVKLLEERGIPFDRVDYMIDPIPRAKLVELVAKMGGRPRDLLRARDAAALELAVPVEDMSDDEVFDLLAVRPELVQRPIVERGDRAVVARPVERVETIL
ncbi:MAG: ArsC/Spx/MgsR family protein [Longimicrobiales bacterium]